MDFTKMVAGNHCCGRPHSIDMCGFLLRAGFYSKANEAKAKEKLSRLGLHTSHMPTTTANASHVTSNHFGALESESEDDGTF